MLNGTASKLIESYESEGIKPELQPLRDTLKKMHEDLNRAVDTVKGLDNNEAVDFNARRLVEMAGYTILGNLVMLDATRSDMFRKSAEVFVDYGRSMVARHADFIASFRNEKMEYYK